MSLRKILAAEGLLPWPKNLKQLRADPRVREVWTEEDGWNEDGKPSFWVALKPGWQWEGISTLHEGTLKGVLAAFREIYPV